jgi:hypothetical protein
MLETLAGVFTPLRQGSPLVFSGVAIACALPLFAPGSVMAFLGLAEAREVYRPYLGGALLVSGSFLAAQGVALAQRRVSGLLSARNKRRGEEQLEAGQTTLQTLTADEKAYLAPYILRGDTTVYYQIEDVVVGGLEARSILYRASNVGRALTGFAYNLQPWARDYLTANPHLLEGARSRPSGPPTPW